MYQHKQYAVFIFVVLAWIGGFVALAWNLMGADVPLMVFAGIGIRITHDGWIYSVSGFSAVQLTLKDGTQYRLGTNDQAGLVAALEDKITPVEMPVAEPQVKLRTHNNML